MVRSLHKDLSITQKNNTSCIANKRGMARRAKRNSNKRDRQLLRKELEGMLRNQDKGQVSNHAGVAQFGRA